MNQIDVIHYVLRLVPPPPAVVVVGAAEKRKRYPFDESQEFNEANVEALIKGVADGSIEPLQE